LLWIDTHIYQKNHIHTQTTRHQSPQSPQSPQQSQQQYYLGVLHFWRPTNKKDGRSYHHYLYKMQPEPPFRALQVSGLWVGSV